MKGYCLCVGTRVDPMLRYLVQALVPFFSDQVLVLDQQHLGQGIRITEEGIVWRDGSTTPHHAIAVVVNRMMGEHPDACLSDEGQVQRSELIACLNKRWPRVMNTPLASLTNVSKTYQMQLVRSVLGDLLLPPSRISVHAQAMVPAQPWIYKSASNVRSYVQCLDAKDHLRWVAEPVLFQSRIYGTNVRVHVIGDQWVACKAKSQALDYRTDKRVCFESVVLPSAVSQACLRLTQALGLVMSGIDLIETKKGWVFLEANPAPGFSFFESENDRPVTACLIAYVHHGLASHVQGGLAS